MKVFVILCFSCSVVSATVYTWDFNELPSGWTADPEWTFDASGAHVTVTASSSGPPVTHQSSLESEGGSLILPDGTDSVLVVVEYDYELEGYYYSGESYANVTGTIYLNSEPFFLISHYQSWGFPADIGTDDALTTASLSFPASPGDNLAFTFRGSAGAYSAYACAQMDLFSMVVTVYDAEELQRHTWASLKTLF